MIVKGIVILSVRWNWTASIWYPPVLVTIYSLGNEFLCYDLLSAGKAVEEHFKLKFVERDGKDKNDLSQLLEGPL